MQALPWFASLRETDWPRRQILAANVLPGYALNDNYLQGMFNKWAAAFTVVAIDRVQNPVLWRKYQVRTT